MVCIDSCKHHSIAPICEDLPPSNSLNQFYQYTSSTYNYGCVSFNPNNEHEILFYRHSKTSVDICIYNLQTKELRVVYSRNKDFGTGGVEWGNNDWIYFPLKDMLIWRIKTNGDSLSQVASDALCFFPKLNTKLHKMIYYHFWNVPEFTGHIYIADEAGNVLDSIKGTMQASVWENNNNIALFSHLDSINSIGTVQVLNPLTKERIDISSYNFEGNGEGSLCWIDENTLFYTLVHGIYRVDIQTKKTIQLQEMCDTKLYGSLSYAKMLNKFVAIKGTQKIVGDNLVEVRTWICLLDLAGNEVEIIDIPE